VPAGTAPPVRDVGARRARGRAQGTSVGSGVDVGDGTADGVGATVGVGSDGDADGGGDDGDGDAVGVGVGVTGADGVDGAGVDGVGFGVAVADGAGAGVAFGRATVVVRHFFAFASHRSCDFAYFVPALRTTSPSCGVSSAASTAMNGDTTDTFCDAVRETSVADRDEVPSTTARTGDAAAELSRRPPPEPAGWTMPCTVIFAGARSTATARPPLNPDTVIVVVTVLSASADQTEPVLREMPVKAAFAIR